MTVYRAKPPKGSLLQRGDRLARSLKLAWLFNETTGLTVRDAAGAAHGTISNIATVYTSSSGWTGGRFGKCLACDGSDDQVNSAADPFQGDNPTDNWALACVVTPRSNVGEQAYFGHSFDTGAGGSSGYIIELESAQIKILYSGIIRQPTGASVIVNQNYAILATRRAGSLYVYVNGLEYPALTGIAPTAPAATGKVSACFQFGGANRFATANIEAGFVWHCAISQREALAWCADPFRMFRRRGVWSTVPPIPDDFTTAKRYVFPPQESEFAFAAQESEFTFPPQESEFTFPPE